MVKFLIAALLGSVLSGCASYVTPGRAADMSVFGLAPRERDAATDQSVLARLERRPLATLPSRLAIAHVQEPGYRSYAACGFGGGRYSIVSAREVETDDDLARIGRLALVRGVAPINSLLVPSELRSDEQVRQAAASLGADMVLVYTFDTRFKTEDFAPPLGLVTLGLFPTRSVRVQTTASAVLLDTRNGYVYAVAEGSGSTGQPANGWTTDAAVDQSRLRAEREALGKLLAEFERAWGGVVNELAARSVSPAPPMGMGSWRDRPVRTWNTAETGGIAPPGERYPTAPR